MCSPYRSVKRVTVKKNKVRRADLFCEGWVDSVKHLIIGLDIAVPANTSDDRAANDYYAGKQSGKSAQLNQAVNGGKQHAQIGVSS